MLEKACHWLLHVASRAQSRLMIVQFHRVLSGPDNLLDSEPDKTRFDAHIGWLARRFNVLTVGDALDRLYAGSLPPLSLCLTFDDGYRDNATNALPILQRHGVAGTFFVTTRFRDAGMMWNDRVVEALRHWPDALLDLSRYGLEDFPLPSDRAAVLDSVLMRIKYVPYREREALADDLFARSGAPARRMMMNAEEIRALHAAGMEVGGHTDGHPILKGLDDGEAMCQITSNKATLEDIVGTPIKTFAYPNGRPARDFSVAHRDMVCKAGYRYALTTAAGTANMNCDPYQVPRFTPADRVPSRYLARLALNYFRDPEPVPG